MGLHGDAFLLAHDLGHDTLMTPGPFVKLFEAIKKTIFPRAGEEGCELLPEGQRAGGVLSRQSGDRCSVTPQDAAHGGIAGEVGPTIQFSEVNPCWNQLVCHDKKYWWSNRALLHSCLKLLLKLSWRSIAQPVWRKDLVQRKDFQTKEWSLVSFLTRSWRLGWVMSDHT